MIHCFFTMVASLIAGRNGGRMMALPSLSVMSVSFTQSSKTTTTVTTKKSLIRYLSSSPEPRRIQAFIEGAAAEARRDRHIHETTAASAAPFGGAASLTGRLALTRTAIHRMRVADLRLELQRRQEDSSGNKKELIPRLLDSIANDNPHCARDSDLSMDNGSNMATESSDPLDPTRRYVLQIKGLSSHTSNGTGVGFVLIDEQEPTLYWEVRKYLPGNRSVFEAEYSSLVLAMRYVIRRGVANVIVHMDHEVIQQQITGTFPVEKESLKHIYWKFVSCKEGLVSFSTQLINFADNHRATDLAKKALATGKSLNVCDVYDPMAEHFRRKMQNGIGPLENDHEVGQAIDPLVTYRLQFDGGARGNPNGVAGAGMVLYDDKDQEIWCGWKYLDMMSNNSAEYWALLLGLKCAYSLGIKKIRCQGDSELIVKQVTGVYRVKDAKLRALFEPTKEIAGKFDSISFEHIYRNANDRADWLANYAMDTRTDHGFEEI